MTFPPPKVVETLIPVAAITSCYPFSMVPALGVEAIILQSLHLAFQSFYSIFEVC